MIDWPWILILSWLIHNQLSLFSSYMAIESFHKFIFTEVINSYGPGQLGRYSDSLRAGMSGNRIPVEAKFSAPVLTSPESYPTSYTMGTGSFPEVKRPGRGADHPPPSKCRGHERVGLCLNSPSGPQWPFAGRTFMYLLIDQYFQLHATLINSWLLFCPYFLRFYHYHTNYRLKQLITCNCFASFNPVLCVLY